MKAEDIIEAQTDVMSESVDDAFGVLGELSRFTHLKGMSFAT